MGNVWTDPACLTAIKALGGVQCDANHCDSTIIQNYSHAYCSCTFPYLNGCPANNPPPGCCSFNGSSPLPVYSLNCYCCCSCFANDTPVAYDKDQYKAISEFEINVDMVYVADDVTLKSWSRRPVLFSSGSGDKGAHNLMLKVSYGDGQNSDYLLVNRSQLFLMYDRTLKPAATLVPGTDSLVDADGKAWQVQSLELGTFDKGLHHIATSVGPARSPNGHLLLAKNIVCGDWALQVSMFSDEHVKLLPVEPDIVKHPEFGTREYAAKHVHLDHAPFRAALAAATPAAVTTSFAALDEDDSAYVPENAFAFLTKNQSWDIFNKAPMASPASLAGKEVLRYLLKLFGGFYPHIDFYYDERSLKPNVYYFEEYGVPRVIVTGGVGRCETLQIEGMALMIATAIGASTGGPPLNDAGFSCLGIAAYSAVGSVMSEVWIGLEAVPKINAGVAQLQALFKFIDKANKGGRDSCMNISTDCLIASMQASFNLMPLPHCAGGPPDPALKVASASAADGTPHSTVSITFNLPVDPTSVTSLGNYSFEPMANTFSASIDPSDPTTVLVAADLAPKTTYQVTVFGVLSSNNEPLVPSDTSAKFTTA